MRIASTAFIDRQEHDSQNLLHLIEPSATRTRSETSNFIGAVLREKVIPRPGFIQIKINIVRRLHGRG